MVWRLSMPLAGNGVRANSSAPSSNLDCAASSCRALKAICCRMPKKRDRRLPLPPLSVEDAQLFDRFKPFGWLGIRLTRGTINAAALFAIMEKGVFEELPDLRVVVT